MRSNWPAARDAALNYPSANHVAHIFSYPGTSRQNENLSYPPHTRYMYPVPVSIHQYIFRSGFFPVTVFDSNVVRRRHPVTSPKTKHLHPPLSTVNISAWSIVNPPVSTWNWRQSIHFLNRRHLGHLQLTN